MSEPQPKGDLNHETYEVGGNMAVAETFQRVARELEEKLESIEGENSSLKAEVTELKHEIEETSGARDQYERELRGAAREVARLQEKVEDMRAATRRLVQVRNLVKAGKLDEAQAEIERELHHIDSAWRTLA